MDSLTSRKYNLMVAGSSPATNILDILEYIQYFGYTRINVQNF